MDRLDYLARDSFYSGVTEGKVGSERIIKMLDVEQDQLVVEEKGVYSIEKFIVARRLMYWQVYLHRTVLSAEHMLMLALKRAKDLSRQGELLFASPALTIFLQNDFDKEGFKNTEGVLDKFCDLDDSDIYNAMKAWRLHPDKVLSDLSSNEEEALYYVSAGSVENQSYVQNGIMLKSKSGDLIDFAKANDNLTIESLSRNVVKSFLCYPKDMPERNV